MENHSPSFAKDVLPLFRKIDIDHMAGMDVFLDDYEFMSDPNHAGSVYEYLEGKKQPQMPPGGPYWSAEQLALLKAWMDNNYKP